MTVINLDTHRQLKTLRDRMTELDRAIETFEGELAELGALRAKFYATAYRAAELQRDNKESEQ